MDKKEVFVLIGTDSEDINGWCQWVFDTQEKAIAEMYRKVKEECFYLGIVNLEEHVEVDDEEYNKFWENKTVEEVLENSNSSIDDYSAELYSWYGRIITYQILQEVVN